MHPHLGVTITGLKESANISCMTNIPVSSIKWRDETSTLDEISATNVTLLEYTIDPVKDDLQGHRLACVALAGTTVYIESQIVAVRGTYMYVWYEVYMYSITPSLQYHLTH